MSVEPPIGPLHALRTRKPSWEVRAHFLMPRTARRPIDGFVIDSKRMRNLHLELFEMFNIAIDKAQPLPTGKSNGTRLSRAFSAKIVETRA